MADRIRRTLLQGSLGAGVSALLPGCIAAPIAPQRSADMQVSSIEALRALSPAVVDIVEVAGHRSPADGGGGRFVWAGEHDEADDSGTVIAPFRDETGPGRWLREGLREIELAWFGPVGDGVADDTEPLANAIDSALRTGLPLVLNPGTYHMVSEIRADIGEGQSLVMRGDGATIRRSGSRGILYLSAEMVAELPIVEMILPGGDGITVADASQVRVGDLVEVASGVQLAQSSWTANEYGQVTAIRGNRLILDGPTHNRTHPDRRLAYRMDGATDRLHYRLFWATEIEHVRVTQDRVPLRAGSDYRISGRINQGYDIEFMRTPPEGSEVVLTTATPVSARIFRGGTLALSDLRFESDFSQAGPVTFIDSYGLAPAGSRFTGLDLIEHKAPLDAEGFREGLEGDLFRAGLVNSVVENIQIKGGRYALMALKGRNATYRNVVAEGCWHAVASFNANTINIEDVTAIRCYAAIDSHYAQVQYVNGVTGVACRDGMNHRANGGAIRNALMTDNTSSEINGLNFGVGQGTPLDDRLIADPLDNPRVQFSNSNADLLIADCRFAAPHDPEGFGMYGSFLGRVTFQNVRSDGPLVIDGGGPPPVRELILERMDMRYLVLRGVTDLVSGKRVRAGHVSLDGSSAPQIRFEDSVFDGGIDGSDALIMDGNVEGGLECSFVRCTFRNAARLMAADTPGRSYSFVDCIFEIADTGGYG